MKITLDDQHCYTIFRNQIVLAVYHNTFTIVMLKLYKQYVVTQL